MTILALDDGVSIVECLTDFIGMSGRYKSYDFDPVHDLALLLDLSGFSCGVATSGLIGSLWAVCSSLA